MEFANESERQQWIAEENKRVAQQNKEVLDNSAAAVAKARAERDEKLKNEPPEVGPHPGRRHPGRVADGTAVATPAGPGDDEDDDLGEFDDGDDEDEDDEDDED